MSVRKIIEINEDRCNGCGLCVPNCAEGAIQIIGGKARLVKDSYCDGLGACLGHCPQDALNIIERDADEFNEDEAMEFAKKMDENRQRAKAEHAHGGGCPGSRMRVLGTKQNEIRTTGINSSDVSISIKPQLRQWPVQLSLVPVNAPYFEDADLLVTADCVPYAFANYRLELLKGKALVIGCPKLDDIESYVEKLTAIITNNNLKSITIAHMEVPCCSGIVRAAETALRLSGKDIPLSKIRVTIDGELQN